MFRWFLKWRQKRRTRPITSAWLVGSFSLTGAEMPRHAAAVSALLGTLDVESRFVGYGPRLFCEAHLGQDLSRDPKTLLIVYMRQIFRPQGLAQEGRTARIRAHLWRVWQLWRLIRAPGPVILVRHRFRPSLIGIGELALSIAIRLRLGRRVLAMGPVPKPARIVAELTGRWPRAVQPDLGEERCFAQILRARPEGQRISCAHVRRALGLCRGKTAPSEDLLRDVERCVEQAEMLNPKDLERTLSDMRLAKYTDTPPAILACLEPAAGGTRLEAHLRAIGRGRVARQDFSMRADGHVSQPDSTFSLATQGQANAHLGGDVANLTIGEAITLIGLRTRMQSVEAFRHPWRRAAWADRLAELFPPGHPATPCLKNKPCEIAVHGHASEETGLSMNMWMSLRALQVAGLPARLAPVEGARDLPTISAKPRAALRRDIALYHLNADQIPEAAYRAYRYRAPYQIGFLLWELDRIPQAHRLALDMLDEIWVPSVFLQRLYQPAFRGKVILMRKGLCLPEELPKLDPHLAKPADTKRFLVVFDANSSVVRKNPVAAVRAFQAAFPGRQDVELIVKTTPASASHWGDPEEQMAEIAARAEADPRIRILTEHLPLNVLCQLVASADALVSPHRAEGFGYFPAFAMALGRPVIATDYSGTRDFCTTETGYPVAFSLRDVQRRHAILPTIGARWAEVDIAALADCMRAVYENPGTAERRALKAKALMALDYTVEAQAARYRFRLEELGLVHATTTQNEPLKRDRIEHN